MALVDASGQTMGATETTMVTCDVPKSWRVGKVIAVPHEGLESPVSVAARNPTLEEMLFVLKQLVKSGRLDMSFGMADQSVEWRPIAPELADAFRIRPDPNGSRETTDAGDIPEPGRE